MLTTTERELSELEKINLFARELIKQKLSCLAEKLGIKLRPYCGTKTVMDLLKLQLLSQQECLDRNVLNTQIDYLIGSVEGCIRNNPNKELFLLKNARNICEEGTATEPKKALYYADYFNPITMSGDTFVITMAFRLV